MKNQIVVSETDKPVVVEVVDVETNPVAVFLSSKGVTSRLTYFLDLKSISILLGYPDPYTCPWESLRFQHTQAIRTMLNETISERTGKPFSIVTINRKLSALRGILKTAWRLGLMEAEVYHRAADVTNIKGETIPAGRELSDSEIERLLDVCFADPEPIGVRDVALISLMLTCGLRRAEVAGLNLSDLDPNTGKLIVRGKGRKERTTYLLNEAAQAMKDWVKARGNWEGPIFVPFVKEPGYKGHLTMVRRRMSPITIYEILDKRRKQAGVSKFSPHDLRRTFISNLLDVGVDISVASKLARHSSILITARYDRRGENTKKDATELLHVPYKSRKPKK